MNQLRGVNLRVLNLSVKSFSRLTYNCEVETSCFDLKAHDIVFKIAILRSILKLKINFDIIMN